jgi:hypothetical protein
VAHREESRGGGAALREDEDEEEEGRRRKEGPTKGGGGESGRLGGGGRDWIWRLGGEMGVKTLDVHYIYYYTVLFVSGSGRVGVSIFHTYRLDLILYLCYYRGYKVRSVSLPIRFSGTRIFAIPSRDRCE